MPAAEVPPTGSSGTAPSALLAAMGKGLVALGFLTLAFAAFQLWGTGLVADQAQDRLAADFDLMVARAGHPNPPAAPGARDDEPVARSTRSSGDLPAPGAVSDRLSMTTADRAPSVGAIGQTSKPQISEAQISEAQPSVGRRVADPHVAEGEAIATLVIPAIGVDKTVVQGTGRDALATGPGRYMATPLPGRSGNAGIAGHRTTHGAPFLDIDLLEPGDEIMVETLDGTFTYLVEGQDDGAGGQVGHLIVDPAEVSVLADKGDNRLTLTACHPKFSARQRIIVTATLVGEPFAPSAASPLPIAAAASTPAFTPTGPVMLDRPKLSARGVAVDTPTIAQLSGDSAGGVTQPVLDVAARRVGSPSAIGVAGPDIGWPGGPAGPSLGWQPDYFGATLRWAATTAAMIAAALVVGRRWRRFPSYAMAVPPVTLSLFNLFANLERFLPAL